jgi:hypothetical protein
VAVVGPAFHLQRVRRPRAAVGTGARSKGSRAGKALPFERLRGRFMRPSCWTHDVDRAND